MDLFDFKEGRVVRQQDGQPVRTKIVATIGSPSSYRKGLVNLSNKKVRQITYDYLVSEFYRSGVDVIRLNLSHLAVDKIEDTFLEIKEAVLKCERLNNCRKRIALLADLPGPKIRFDFTGNVSFKVGQKFTIHFEDDGFTDKGEIVYVDAEPLKRALALLDGNKMSLDEAGARHFEDLAMVENVLGGRFMMPTRVSDSFQMTMNEIRTRLDDKKRVLAVVGDGEVVMNVNRAHGTVLNCTVVTVKGGEFKAKDHPGFTLKGIDLNIPSFTNEDRQKLSKLLEAEYKGFDTDDWEPLVAFVGLSFTQTADDVLKTKEYIERKLTQFHRKNRSRARVQFPGIIAKIETNKGWQNKHYILDVADGIMVARGDLGLQTDIEEVPAIQKRLIQLCRKRGKPVITATEMLKSMIESVEPTRAEGTDVFNAILDGSDAVMLSEETSKGKYPFHAILKMMSIAVRAEWYFERHDMGKDLRRRRNLNRFQEFLNDDFERIAGNTGRFKRIENTLDMGKVLITEAEEEGERKTLDLRKELYEEKWRKSVVQTTTNRITQATCTMAESEDVKCIIAASTSGRTVRMISRLRPSVIIVGAAHDIINTRMLAVSYGVLPICVGEADKKKGTEGVFVQCENEIRRDAYLGDFLRRGDPIIFTAGTPLGRPGTTNLIQLRKIGQ